MKKVDWFRIIQISVAGGLLGARFGWLVGIAGALMGVALAPDRVS